MPGGSQASGEPRLSVVVPCLDEAPYIESLLEAIRLQDRPPFEVIVVDGGSTDGTQGVVARYCLEHPNPPVTIVVQPNGRIPVSLNAGIRAASGDVIARLDAHSRPRPDYLGRLVGLLLESDPGVTGGRWEIEPGRPSRMGHAIAWAVQHPLGAGDAAYRLVAGDGRIRPVDTVPFGCFRKAVWAELGGFNETLQANEDYEFNYRVRRSGRRVLLDPGAVSIYAARGTLGQLARQYFRYGWWKLAMLKRYPRALRWRQAVPMLFVGVLGVLGAASLISPSGLPWLGVTAGGYLLVLGLVSPDIARRRRAWRTLPVLPLAFITVHFAWGCGAWVNGLTFGCWPRWR